MKNRSFETFIDAVSSLYYKNNNKLNNNINLNIDLNNNITTNYNLLVPPTAETANFDETLATIASTYRTTAILQAGRLSLDTKKL